MITIPQSFIDEAGLNLDEATKKDLDTEFTATLQERVGNEILAYLTDDKVDEYNDVLDTRDDERIQKWLIDNVPDLNDIVTDEAHILIDELRANSKTNA